jgi:cyclopropane-fatty-acyl-phospholipid synthase
MTTVQTVTKTDNNYAWKFISSLLNSLKKGRITVYFEEDKFEFGSTDRSDVHAQVTVHDAQLFSDMLTGGSMAAAEGYMKGYWDSPDLTKVVRLFAMNIDTELNKSNLLSALFRITSTFKHFLNRNSVTGSKKNIGAHYDLGNDLFESFLDDSMMYSAAIYPSEDASLGQAQHYRLDRICQKLHLSEDNHLLEIGTGWGALAIHAAKHYGCKVTTTTISEEQHALAAERIKQEKLEDKITLLKEDYRNLEGQFDRLVSIEMIEAVGHEYLPGYFKKIDELLTEDGIALLQSITIPDQRYKSYRNSVDFIRKYIFPGGHLPSISMINHLIATQTAMTVNHFEDITEHYARTLKDWHERFVKNYNTLPTDKYDRQFYRMWRYYLAYCEGGFIERAIGTSQIVFSKSGAKHEWIYH